MKSKFLFGVPLGAPISHSFAPPKCIGAELLAAGIAATASTINSIASNYASTADSGAARDYDWNKYHELRQWQEADNAMNWQHQLELLKRDQSWQTSERQASQWYNSPSRKVSQLLAAGLNPAVVFGQTPNAPTAPAASNPQPAYTPIPTAGTPGIGPGVGNESFRNFADAIATLSEASLKMVNNPKQREMIDATIQKYFSDSANAEAQAAYTETLGMIAQYKMDKEYEKLCQDIAVAAAQEDYLKAEKILKEAETRLANENSETAKQVRPVMISNMKKIGKLTDADIALRKSQKVTEDAKPGVLRSEEFRNYGQGGLATEQALTEEQLRQFKVGLEKEREFLVHNQNVEWESTKLERLRALINVYEREGYLTEKEIENLKKAVKDNNTYYIDKFFKWVDEYSGAMWKGSMAFQNIVSTFSSFKGPARPIGFASYMEGLR